MNLFALDREEALLVKILCGQPEEADWDTLFEAAAELDAAGVKYEKRTAQILIVEEGYPRPNATQRRRLADAMKTLQVKSPLFALVTKSAAVRGVLTLLGWVTRPVHETAVFATFEEAASWIESKRGQSLPVLRALEKRARDQGKLSSSGL